MPIYTPSWVSRIQDALTIPQWLIRPLFNVQWGFGWKKWPNPLAIRIQTFTDTPSFYMNGLVFFGIQTTCVCLMLRWWGDGSPFTIFGREFPAFVQMHIGWRPIDGAPVIVLRFQCDESAQGGLAVGFEDGGK